MKLSTVLIALLSSTALLVTACGKDFDTDDYKREHTQKELAKIRSAEGTYSGVATSNVDGSVLGAVEIKFAAITTVIANPTDESDQSTQPNLQATIVMTGPTPTIAPADKKNPKKPTVPGTDKATRMQIVAQNGHFDVDSGGAYNADVNITRQVNGVSTTDTLSLDGYIANGHYIGHIFSKPNPNYGAKFDLVLNGPTADVLMKGQKASPEKFASQQFYQGNTNFYFGRGGTKPVVLILLTPPTTTPSEDAFINLLKPQKSLNITLNYGNGARLTFPNATLDVTTGQLSANATVTQLFPTQMLATMMRIDCSKPSNKDEFQCDLSSAGTAGVVASTYVKKTDKQEPDGKDNSRGLDLKSYSGKGRMTATGPNTDDICLVVSYAARTRIQEIFDLIVPTAEKTVTVSWSTRAGPIGRTGTTFQTVNWDDTAYTLDGSQTFSINQGETGNMTLHCDQFVFSADSAFTCRYTNSINGAIGNFSFAKGATKQAEKAGDVCGQTN